VDPSQLSRRALLVGSAAALGCSHPKATGFRGLCFVANEAGRSVGVVDLSHFRIRKRIALDTAPSLVMAHPTEHRALVLSRDGGTVYDIDAVKLEVARRGRAGNAAVGMQFSESGDAVWVLYADPAALVEFPLATMRPGRRIRLNSTPHSFDVNGGRALVASTVSRNVVLASLGSGAVERTVTLEDEPSLVAFRKDGRHFFTASRPERAMTIFDSNSCQTVVRLPLPVEPRQFSTKPDGGQLFISGAGMDAIVVVYVYQTEIAETLLAGKAPGAMAAMDVPGYLLVANPETNSVTVLDLDNNGRLVASVQVGQEPRAILMTPARPGQDQYALVLNEKSGDLAVIRIKSLPQDAESRRRPTPLFNLIPVGEKPVSAAVMSFA
jgi:DNA-binding beta-propeller fold protein YncE